MQQLTFFGAGDARWTEAPTPVMHGPLEALIRPTAVTTCALDVALMQGLVGEQKPFAVGHEFLGTVIDIGDDVGTIGIGDQVVVSFEISCGVCHRCKAGLTANCAQVPKNAMFGLAPWSGADYGGALADVVRVPYADAMCLPLPPGTPAAAASLGDNTTDAWRAVGPYVDPLNPQPVLVVGNGAIGVAAVAIAQALGADTTYIATDEADKGTAEMFGARIVDASTFPRKAKGKYGITVSSGGDHEALHCAIRSTDHGGVCTDTGIFFERSTPLPLFNMYDTGLTFCTGRAHVRRDLPAVLALVNGGKLDVGKLIQAEAQWDDAPAAFSGVHQKLLITRDHPDASWSAPRNRNG